MDFHIRDNDDVPDDVRERVEEMVNQMSDIVLETTDDPVEMLNACATLVAFIVGESACSREIALKMVELVSLVCLKTLKTMEVHGSVNWNQEVKH